MFKKPPATTVSETDARAFTAIVAASFATEDGNAARGEALEVPPVMSNAAPRATVQDGPKGVEGWLTLFCIGLIIGPLFTLLEMPSNWEQAKPAFDRFPPLKTAVIFENLGCVALWIYGFVVGWTVFRESPSGRKVAKQYLLIRFFGCIGIELFAIVAMLPLPADMVALGVRRAVGIILSEGVLFLVWWFYFKKSKPVRNTFGDEMAQREVEHESGSLAPTALRHSETEDGEPVLAAVTGNSTGNSRLQDPLPPLQPKVTVAQYLDRNFSSGNDRRSTAAERISVTAVSSTRQPTTGDAARWQRRAWLVAVAVFAVVFVASYKLLTGGSTPPTEPEPRTAVQSRLAPDAIFVKASPSVVQVVTYDARGRAVGTGSGFLVSTKGLIATNYHVIEKAYAAHVVLPDKTKEVVLGVAALNEEADIAILAVDEKISVQPLELATSPLPQVGSKVYAIGTPLGFFANTLSDGLVSGHREIGRLSVLQTTTPISPGSSGGPLLGADGKVVGVTTCFFQGGQNINIAVPASQIARLLLQCEREVVQLTQFPLVRQSDVFAYMTSGNAWIDKKNYDEAIKDFDKAIRLDPDYAPAYMRRGLASLQKNRYAWATSDFDQAIRLNPQDALAYYHRASARMYWGKYYEGAISDYNKAIRLDPKYAPAYLGRGTAWMEKKEYDKAIDDFDEAIRLEPTNALFYFLRGVAWLDKQNYDQAIRDFDEAIRLDPNCDGAYLGRERARSRKMGR